MHTHPSLRVASVVAYTTHLTGMPYLLTAVSVWELEEMFQELHTCLLVSKLTCSLIYVTDPLFQGSF